MQEDVNHEEHQHKCDNQGHYHLFYCGEKEFGNVVVYLIFKTRREGFGLLFQHLLHVLCNLCGVRTGNLLHHTHRRRMAVILHRYRITQCAQLNLGHVFQVKRLALRIVADDDVAVFFGRFEPSLIAHHVFEGHIALFAKRTWRGLNVLFGRGCSYIARHQPVLFHLVGLQPNAHRIGTRTKRLHVTHTLHTLNGRLDVDFVEVGDELLVVTSVGRRDGVHQHVTRLPFRGGNTHLRNLCGQQCLCLRHAVLHVHGSHVGVNALLKVDGYHGRTVVCGGTLHVGHVLHAVAALFKGYHHGVENRLRIGSLIVRHHRNGGRSDVGILRNGQRHDAD